MASAARSPRAGTRNEDERLTREMLPGDSKGGETTEAGQRILRDDHIERKALQHPSEIRLCFYARDSALNPTTREPIGYEIGIERAIVE